MKKKVDLIKGKFLDFRYELLFFFFALYKLFWPYDLYRQKNMTVNFLAIFALILFFVFLVGRVAGGELAENSKKSYRLILCFFWISFVSNAALYLENWPKDYEGTKHALAIFCYLLIFFVFDRGKLKWLIPFLLFIMIVLKPEIALALLPSVFLLFYYHSCVGKFSDETKDLLASTIILTLIALAIFLPKTFRKSISFSVEQIPLHMKTALFSYFVVLPLIIFLALIVFKASAKASNKKVKFFLKLMFFLTFASIPILPFASNNVSLSMLGIFATLVLLGYLLSEADKSIVSTLEKIWDITEKKEFVFLVFISVVFMAYFSVFTKSSLGSLFYSKSFVNLWP